ncbi:MAG: glycosyltransferase family 4 protein [Candidatus Komeilibacteria bacterium CG10_big_fil_rev_8_21_14_0_10_41_13]|uniref:Glycosyltransferase family 4 protein n=1 Tax=Candidatus Komeilibacteria bacterium CG10_big_fil_rev_8_21_14_0_10_41_13 TaxID=1974476 RepID=A0A2M6WCF9_9BACT|nr:MAG: glycosyltransferase family 4 protein [Candidatus Komeilibacteria bacterium CG10_big_fil_rev_8_21_14_0_10_41_13]
MKVALTHDHLFQIGGAEKVLLELHNIFPESPVYTLIHNPEKSGLFNDLDIKTSFLQKLPFARNHFKWYLGLMPIAWEQLDFSDYDIVISSSSAFSKGILTPPNTLNISYCHSPTRYLWSDAHKYVEELKQPKVIKKLLPIMLNRLRTWDYTAAQRVDKFIANSEFVAKRIKKYYQRESTVIYPPVETDKFKISEELGNYYVLVSRLRPYKKVDLAIKAFNKLHIPLKIIGGGEEITSLKKIAKDNIEFLGEASDQKRNEVISKALAFIHPQEEDFGIAAVEAMASGRPVIAYKSGGALETVQEGLSGKLFAEQSWEALAEAVLEFQKDLNNYDARAIKNHAENFSVNQFEKKMKDFVSQSWQEFSGRTLQL